MLSMAANAEDAAGRPVVEVAHGRLLGSRIGRLYAFRGVPYAIADRFGPPQPVPAFTGIREAVHPGPICPQLPSRLEIIMGPPKQSRRMSEACQVLSIFSPDLNGKRPVMAWFRCRLPFRNLGKRPTFRTLVVVCISLHDGKIALV